MIKYKMYYDITAFPSAGAVSGDGTGRERIDMSNRKKALISAILTIAMCLSVVAGSTFALMTSESGATVTVTSGKVSVQASLSDVQLYSAEEDPDGELTDPAGATYRYVLREDDPATDGVDESRTFSNGGTAILSGNSLTLDRITRGDKATFRIHVANHSSVKVRYRVWLLLPDGETNGLSFSIDNAAFSRRADVTGWEELDVPSGGSENLSTSVVSVCLPMDTSDEYQGRTTVFSTA